MPILEIETSDELNDEFVSVAPSIKQDFKALYENSPDLLRTVNTDGIILNCNKSYAEHLGYSKEELIGTSIFETISNKSMDSTRKSFKIWSKIGRVKTRRVWLKRRDGSTLPTLVSANNLYDDFGKLIGSNTVILDISELYNEKQRLRELEKVDKQKEKFVSMITHDIRTLLFPVQGYARLLKRGKGVGTLNSKQLAAVDKILDFSRRLEGLASDILDVHKLDLEQMKFNNDNIDVRKLLSSITTNFAPLINEKQIKFVNKLPKKSLTLHSDEKKLVRVFSNLIKNSMDFLPKKNAKIEIGGMEQSDYVIFYVQDNGIGIRPEKQEILFKEFFQVDDTNSGRHGGVGLGLAICKGMVEQIGGRIWVESTPAEGATFYFSIPNVPDSQTPRIKKRTQNERKLGED